MAETGKRIEVRCGAFACRVEGFDDPVSQLREVLSLMQRMISETPALADHAADLDDAQIARINDALGAQRARNGTTGVPGIIVIRGEEGSPEDVADAETLPEPQTDDALAPEEPPDAMTTAEVGPHLSAAGYAVPAAAMAEAAFAAGIAAEEADPMQDDAAAQGPLGAEVPDEAATPAALFAAPAAGAAEGRFTGGLAAATGPADPDDDAGDPELPLADEAAEERIPASGGAHAPADGGPGAGWNPWRAGPAPATGIDPAGLSAADTDDGRSEPDASGTDDAPAAPSLGEPAPDFDEDDAAPLPSINIFAPPPDDVPAWDAAEPQRPAGTTRARRSEPLAALLREPGPAAADPEAMPHRPTAGTTDRRRAAESSLPDDAQDEPDEVPDGGAADWPEPEERPDGEPESSSENRLAALITRYQSDPQGRAEGEPVLDAAFGTLSATALAERAEAKDVADLLAVSAAWLTLVDGRARFTRREVMEVFETLPGDHPRTLEARIKGFGNLVRSGTLQLVDESAFALAARERARFRALIDQP